MTGLDVATQARVYLGAKWGHQGRTRERMDCIGLVIRVAHDLEVSEFDIADYSRHATDESLRDGCREHMQEIALAAAQPGDVAVMRYGPQRHIGFLGNYAHGGLSLIHSSSLAPRRVVEVRLDSVWRSRIMGVFRFPGVA